MKSTQPVCKTLRAWLKANLGPRCLAGCTGTDYRALDAAAHLLELYAHNGHEAVLHAYGYTVREMQESTRELAFHAVAHVLDWGDRFIIWDTLGLCDADHFTPKQRCKYER